MGGGGGCCVAACCIGQILGCCIGDGIKTVVKKIFGSSSGSSSGGKTESYHQDTATLEETIKVQEALSKFRSDTQSRSAKLENAIVKESRQNLDAFVDELRQCNKIKYGNRRLNINIRYIEWENRKTEDTIHGFIVKRVSTKVSKESPASIGEGGIASHPLDKCKKIWYTKLVVLERITGCYLSRCACTPIER